MAEPRIAFLTAGAAGMYCGSCLRDNTLVAALCRQGVDATLIPTYTPIRTDDEDVSSEQVFFGGVNVFLQQKLALFRYLPRWLDRWLDRPSFLRWVARDAVGPGPQVLGELTLSMLRGTEGNQVKEVHRLCDWLEREFHPQLIDFTNILIGGCIPTLKRRLRVPITVTLQGDDVFLDYLSATHRRAAIEQIRKIAEHVDRFLVFSQFYADTMRDYLGLRDARFEIVPLGIAPHDFAPQHDMSVGNVTGQPTIGYLARIAPEKGFHRLVDAYLELIRREGMQDVRLLAAGWLGKQHEAYANEQFARLKATPFEYLGCVDRAGKVSMLRAIDVFCVPTEFAEPKGIYALEALAAGVPVVEPARGAFPELLASTGGARLYPPDDRAALVDTLHALVRDRGAARQLGAQGRQGVIARHSAETMASATLRVYRELLASST